MTPIGKTEHWTKPKTRLASTVAAVVVGSPVRAFHPGPESHELSLVKAEDTAAVFPSDRPSSSRSSAHGETLDCTEDVERS